MLRDVVNVTPSQLITKYFVDQGKAIANSNSNSVDWRIVWGASIPGSEWDKTLNKMPNNFLAVFDTTPIANGRGSTTRDRYWHYAVQVFIRSLTYPIGRTKGRELEESLNAIEDTVVTISGVDTTFTIPSFKITTGLIQIFEEEQLQRKHFTINGIFTIREN